MYYFSYFSFYFTKPVRAIPAGSKGQVRFHKEQLFFYWLLECPKSFASRKALPFSFSRLQQSFVKHLLFSPLPHSVSKGQETSWSRQAESVWKNLWRLSISQDRSVITKLISRPILQTLTISHSSKMSHKKVPTRIKKKRRLKSKLKIQDRLLLEIHQESFTSYS